MVSHLTYGRDDGPAHGCGKQPSRLVCVTFKRECYRSVRIRYGIIAIVRFPIAEDRRLDAPNVFENAVRINPKLYAYDGVAQTLYVPLL